MKVAAEVPFIVGARAALAQFLFTRGQGVRSHCWTRWERKRHKGG